MCLLRYSHSRVQSGRNTVCLHLFLDFSHVLIFLPFIPVTLTDYFGLSDACVQILTVVKMVVCLIQDILYIYRTSLLEFV